MEEWLDGPPPVFFGFGSMPVLDPNALLDSVKRICQKHSIRALIGSGWTRYPTTNLPDSIFIAPAFDHDRVLPRCCAAVHHGGAGTTPPSGLFGPFGLSGQERSRHDGRARAASPTRSSDCRMRRARSAALKPR